MSFKLVMYLNLCYCDHFKVMLFLLTSLQLDIVLLFMNSFVILFPLQTLVCDVYLLNHPILVVMWIYHGPS